MVTCAVCVALTFWFRETLALEGKINVLVYSVRLKLIFTFFSGDGWGLTGACSLIVIIGTLANLASVAGSIVVYKDWIAIIAEGDSDKLARN